MNPYPKPIPPGQSATVLLEGSKTVKTNSSANFFFFSAPLFSIRIQVRVLEHVQVLYSTEYSYTRRDARDGLESGCRLGGEGGGRPAGYRNYHEGVSPLLLIPCACVEMGMRRLQYSTVITVPVLGCGRRQWRLGSDPPTGSGSCFRASGNVDITLLGCWGFFLQYGYSTSKRVV